MYYLLKTRKESKSLKKLRDTKYIYRNELDKSCFQHDMAYGDFKGLAKISAADKVLRDKAFNIAKYPKYDEYQRGLASMVYKFFDKSNAGSGINSMPQNEQLAEEFHKPIIIKFRKTYQKSIFNIQRQYLWC